jgi:hypothetical protein
MMRRLLCRGRPGRKMGPPLGWSSCRLSWWSDLGRHPPATIHMTIVPPSPRNCHDLKIPRICLETERWTKERNCSKNSLSQASWYLETALSLHFYSVFTHKKNLSLIPREVLSCVVKRSPEQPKHCLRSRQGHCFSAVHMTGWAVWTCCQLE